MRRTLALSLAVALLAAGGLALEVSEGMAHGRRHDPPPPPTKTTLCVAPHGRGDAPKTREVWEPLARWLVARGRATPGSCPVHFTCGDRHQEVSCADVVTLEDAAVADSQRAESLEQRLLQPGRPEIPIDDVTSRPPRASVMGACIDAAYAAEPEVGYAWAIDHDGALADSGAGGWARAPWESESPSVPMTPDKPMTLASISKIITSLAVMRMLEEHPEIDLDDPFYPLVASRFAGPFELSNGLVVNIPGPGLEQVTLRHLLTHKSALEPGLGCGNLVLLMGIGVVGTPGVTDHYENHNFCLLRQVIEVVTGMDYVEYVQDRILEPMGIDMDCMPEASEPTLYYNTLGDPGASWGDFTASCSAYGWTGSAEQLARLLGGFRLDEALQPASRMRMLDECPTSGETTNRCLGWQRSTKTVGLHYYHSGDWYTGDPCKTSGDLDGLTLGASSCRKGFNGSIVRFGLGIDASLLVNTVGGSGLHPSLKSELTILRECYAQAFLETNPSSAP